MTVPYTIRIFVPTGEPGAAKVIQKMNWVGVGFEIERETWKTFRARCDFERAGVYVLVGYQEEQDLPTLYIGQGDWVRDRIDDHEKKKKFWDRVLVFVSSNEGLNRGHLVWLEWALIDRARSTGRCSLDNVIIPTEPVLTESEKADTRAFLQEILSVLPIVDLRVFETPKKLHTAFTKPDSYEASGVLDTIVVPAQKDGFDEVFIGENAWYAIRIGGGRLNDIKYIAAYQTAPVSAITHVAQVETIEPYGDGGKFRLNFAAPAKPIGPLPLGNAPFTTMQSPRYTSYTRLNGAKNLSDLFD
jgi:hypothetical protein